jgi:hypothetical protein
VTGTKAPEQRIRYRSVITGLDPVIHFSSLPGFDPAILFLDAKYAGLRPHMTILETRYHRPSTL